MTSRSLQVSFKSCETSSIYFDINILSGMSLKQKVNLKFYTKKLRLVKTES